MQPSARLSHLCLKQRTEYFEHGLNMRLSLAENLRN